MAAEAAAAIIIIIIIICCMIEVRVPEGVGNFPLHHHVHTGPGVHPVFYPMGTKGSFLGGKAAGA
jgi:hypothetical protein